MWWFLGIEWWLLLDEMSILYYKTGIKNLKFTFIWVAYSGKKKVSELVSILYNEYYPREHYLYLASNTVIDTPFTESISDLPSGSDDPASLLEVPYAGRFGSGKNMTSLVSMDITSDIVGLSIAYSWTHKSPTWINFATWSLGHGSSDVSASSRLSPCFHKFQPCNLEVYSVCECFQL